MKAKSTNAYIAELKRMIKSRTGAECEPWLLPQIRSAAMNMVILDQIQNELTSGELTTYEIGSQQQQKLTQHPLLVTYKDLQRTLILQFEALGLNYKTTPSKVKEDTRRGVDESDPLVNVISGIKDALE